MHIQLSLEVLKAQSAKLCERHLDFIHEGESGEADEWAVILVAPKKLVQCCDGSPNCWRVTSEIFATSAFPQRHHDVTVMLDDSVDTLTLWTDGAQC